MNKKIKYIIAVALVIVVAGGLFVFWQARQGNINLPILSITSKADKLGKAAIDYINANLLPPGTTASLVEVTNEGTVYKVKIKIGADEPDVYVSKDGQFLFTAAFEMTPVETPESQIQEQEPPKADRPDIKLFVMSYCSYGLQMEKVYLPVYQLLKDKADFGIYFVDYIMHDKPEIDENLRQYCIQNQSKEEFAEYLDCFSKTGEVDSCLSQTNINQNELSECIASTDNQFNITEQYNDQSTWMNGQYPKFGIHQPLNEQYSIQGSPTTIINDQEVAANERSPEAFKNLICKAFNNPPAECSQVLSTDIPEAGIGAGITTGTGDASCEQ